MYVHFRMEEGADMHCLLMTDNNTLLMGGLQNYVAEVDLNTVQEAQKVQHQVYQHPQLLMHAAPVHIILFIIQEYNTLKQAIDLFSLVMCT